MHQCCDPWIQPDYQHNSTIHNVPVPLFLIISLRFLLRLPWNIFQKWSLSPSTLFWRTNVISRHPALWKISVSFYNFLFATLILFKPSKNIHPKLFLIMTFPNIHYDPLFLATALEPAHFPDLWSLDPHLLISEILILVTGTKTAWATHVDMFSPSKCWCQITIALDGLPLHYYWRPLSKLSVSYLFSRTSPHTTHSK